MTISSTKNELSNTRLSVEYRDNNGEMAKNMFF